MYLKNCIFNICSVADFTMLSITLRVSYVVVLHTMAPLYEVCCILYCCMMVVITFVLDLRDAVLLYCGGEIPPMIITAGINTWAGSRTGNCA